MTGGSSHNGQYSHSNFTKLQECLEPEVYKSNRCPTILNCRKTLNISYFNLFKIKCKYFPLNNKDLSFMDKLFSRTPNTTTQIILQINKLYWSWIKQKVHNKDSLKYQYFHPYDADIWRSEGHRLQLDISSNNSLILILLKQSTQKPRNKYGNEIWKHRVWPAKSNVSSLKSSLLLFDN